LDAAAQAIAAGAGNAGLEFGGVLAAICTYVVGFFATAGAAGTDIASAARNENDVHFGGIFGIMFSTLLAGGAAILIVAGAYGSYEPGAANSLISAAHVGSLNPVDFLKDMLGENVGNLALIGLAISSFPGACFSALIAANSFKTTLPKINPFSSVGLGALVAAILAVTGIVAKVIGVFQVIGASFGPICGAMMADFLLAGKKWSGPRAGFNPAGWISWAVGFAVGAFNLVAGSLTDRFPDLIAWKDFVPAPPVAAFIVGFVLYLGLSLIGARTKTLDMPQSPAA
jgi:cytosine permease